MAVIYRCDVCKTVKERREEVQTLTLPALETGHAHPLPASIRREFKTEFSYVGYHTPESVEACVDCVYRAIVALYTLPARDPVKA